MIRRFAFLGVVFAGLLACGWLALTPAPSLNDQTLALATANAAVLPNAGEATTVTPVEVGQVAEADRADLLAAGLRRGLEGACDSEAVALDRIQIATTGWDLATTAAALERVSAEPSCEAVRTALVWAHRTAADTAQLMHDVNARSTGATVFGRGAAVGGDGGPGYRQGR